MKEQNEKQAIEEMVKDVTEAIKHNSAVDVIRHGLICVNGDGIARELFDDGYRKQSVVIDDFAERLKEKMDDLIRVERDGYTYFVVGKAFIDKIAEEMKGGE